MLNARQRATLLDSTERQLSHQPTLETRHRKRMQPGKDGFVALWELRVGDLRLYYETPRDSPEVRNRLRVAGKNETRAMRTVDIAEATGSLSEYARQIGEARWS